MIVAVITKPWFSKSPWDSYSKTFFGSSEREDDEEFLDWWTSLPDDSFTKKHCLVMTYRVSDVLSLTTSSVEAFLAMRSSETPPGTETL